MPDTSYAPKGPASQPGKRAGHDSADERLRDAAAVAQLKRQVATQAALIARQEVSLAHSRKIFDRASAAARIGVWECSLPDERLTWTDVVYDLFDLPRGCVLDRKTALECYPESSRKMLETMRSRAIAERSGFTLDAEITTFAGRSRWIRITATVECEADVPVRIFGMKQDITEEKILSERMRYLAEFDAMTGLANRARFQARLAHTNEGRPLGALLLVDLDGFKAVNDTFGHVVGDECLKAAAERLAGGCGEAELVARVGGDEFAVLLGSHLDREAVSGMARRLIEAMARPLAVRGQSLRLGASVGIAFAEQGSPCDLFAQADTALYAAKAAGRNTFRIFKAAAGTKGRSVAA